MNPWAFLVLSAIFGVVAQKEHGNRWISIFAPLVFIALWIPFGAFIGLEDEVDLRSWLLAVLQRGWIGMIGGYVGAVFAIVVLKAHRDGKIESGKRERICAYISNNRH